MPPDAANIVWDNPHPADIKWDDAKPQPMGWGDMASQAVQNLPSSTLQLGKNIVTPIVHPIDTATNLYHLGAGIIEKAIPGTQADEATANAVGKYFVDRYGSLEGVKHAIATDPAGVMADASVVLGGGAAALKATGTLGKVADIANAAGHIANPVSLALKGAGAIGRTGGKLASEALGVTTGAGPLSIRTAFDAGFQGGPASQAFTDNMRGNVPMEAVVDNAKAGLSQIRNQRGAEYRTGMGSINSDPTVLDLSPVNQAVGTVSDVNNFKGVDLAESTARTRQRIAEKLAQWQGLDPQEYHTPAGFDALKKSIGDIRDSTQPGTPDRVVANNAYNAVKAEIVKQAPQYADVMSKYSDASENINDLQRTLFLGDKAATDTTIRKLQSALRDNVNTSFGRRTELAKQLAANGAPHLMEQLAGQSLNSPTARGIGKTITNAELVGMAGEAIAGNPKAAAMIVPLLAMQSPRVIGEVAHGLGKAGMLGKTLPSQTLTAKAALIAKLLGQTDQQNTGLVTQ